MLTTGIRIRFSASLVGAVTLSLAALAAPAFALEADLNEKKNLRACEKDLCAMILSTDASGGDFACSISKTWANDSIEKGASTKSLSWGFGDARCTLDLKAARGNVVSSSTNPEHKFEMKPRIP